MQEGHWKLNIGKIRFGLMHSFHVRALGAGEMCVCERLRERKREECVSNNNEYCSSVETTSVFLSFPRQASDARCSIKASALKGLHRQNSKMLQRVCL